MATGQAGCLGLGSWFLAYTGNKWGGDLDGLLPQVMRISVMAGVCQWAALGGRTWHAYWSSVPHTRCGLPVPSGSL